MAKSKCEPPSYSLFFILRDNRRHWVPVYSPHVPVFCRRKIHRPVVRPEQATECRYNPKRALKLALKFEKRMAVHGKIAQLCGYTVVAGFFAMLIVATLWFAEGIFQQVRAGEAEGFVWSWLLAIVWDLVVVEWVYALIKCAVKLAGATYLAVAFGFYNLVDWYEDYCDLTTIDMMAGDKLQKMLTTAMEDNEQMY
mmetsp:Transcript_11633/g.32962  ORF Transcript_11633/g.32962 Transcript_11633/m.32962 type:complete len:196 (+) Transcript_11633:406-993(+)